MSRAKLIREEKKVAKLLGYDHDLMAPYIKYGVNSEDDTKTIWNAVFGEIEVKLIYDKETKKTSHYIKSFVDEESWVLQMIDEGITILAYSKDRDEIETMSSYWDYFYYPMCTEDVDEEWERCADKKQIKATYEQVLSYVDLKSEARVWGMCDSWEDEHLKGIGHEKILTMTEDEMIEMVPAEYVRGYDEKRDVYHAGYEACLNLFARIKRAYNKLEV